MAETLLIIEGVAVSAYARGASRYKDRIRDVARQFLEAPLAERDLSVEVQHFYTSGRRPPDLDNLLKCVLDGLERAAYENDSQVRKVSVARYNISGSFSLEDPRPELMTRLPPRAAPRDFVAEIVRREE